MQSHQSWAIKDEAILDDLQALLKISATEKATLAALQSLATAHAPTLANDFYDRLTQHALTAEFVDGMVNHLKTTLTTWFLDLFSGTYETAYIQNRLKIGAAHVRIGLPIRYPLAMMDLILAHGETIAQQSDDPETALAALHKLVSLDFAIFNQAYEDKRLSHLTEMVGNEKLARLMLTQGS
jgi:hypothetical protein